VVTALLVQTKRGSKAGLNEQRDRTHVHTSVRDARARASRWRIAQANGLATFCRFANLGTRLVLALTRLSSLRSEP
jgi:hypothetical protein